VKPWQWQGWCVEVTLAGLVRPGLDPTGATAFTVLAAEGSKLPPGCEKRHPLEPAGGWISPGGNHRPRQGGVSTAGRQPGWPALGKRRWNRQGDFDAILNLWLRLACSLLAVRRHLGHRRCSTCEHWDRWPRAGGGLMD